MPGHFAGVLVGVYALSKLRREALFPILAYAMIGIAVCYLTWPFIWSQSVGRVFGTARLMTDFDIHMVLFQGRHLPSTDLPWQYLPTLLAIQLTLPALLLGGCGAVLAGRRILFALGQAREATVFLLWFLVPAGAVVIAGTPIYGGFRQILFCLPPLFILGSQALEAGARQLRPPILQGVTAALLVFPGVAGIVQLHPFEYAYFNLLVGGAAGASGMHSLDYWCTSYREVVDFLNESAPKGAKVVAYGTPTTARTFARPDIDIQDRPNWRERPDYAIACREGIDDPGFFPEYRVIHEVIRAGVRFGVVKQAP